MEPAPFDRLPATPQYPFVMAPVGSILCSPKSSHYTLLAVVFRVSCVVLGPLFGCFLLLAQSQAEGVLNVTFDGQPPGTGYIVTNYAERGTRFVGNFVRTGPDSTNRPDNGTAYIQPTGIFLPSGAPATCSRIDGLAFRLVSVELAGYSTAVPDYTALFEGHRSDGTIVTTNFAVTGLTFQTYCFSSEFVDLTNVLIAAGALDNLKLQVPTVSPVVEIRAYPDYYSVEWLNVYAEGTPGIRYRLESNESLLSTNWTSCVESESGVWYNLSKSEKTNAPQRFFRVVELPSP